MDIETKKDIDKFKMEERIMEIENEIDNYDFSEGQTAFHELVKEKELLLHKMGKEWMKS